jgi:hypothetical protein
MSASSIEATSEFRRRLPLLEARLSRQIKETMSTARAVSALRAAESAPRYGSRRKAGAAGQGVQGGGKRQRKAQPKGRQPQVTQGRERSAHGATVAPASASATAKR